MVSLDGRPGRLDATFRPDDSFTVNLTGPAGWLSSRAFTATLGGVALSVSENGDVLTVVASAAITAAATSPAQFVLTLTGGNDALVGTWSARTDGSAQTSTSAAVIIDSLDVAVTLTDATTAADLAAHIADTAGAHAASAISYAGGSGLSADDVEEALDELANEKLDITTATGTYVAPVNVLGFGAEGDGVADDTDAISDALAAAATGSRQVYLPAGTYKVTSTLTVPSGVEVVGESTKSTVIQTTTDMTAFQSIGGEGQALRRFKIANSYTGTRTTHDIVMVNPYHPVIEQVEIALSQLSRQKGGIHIYQDDLAADPTQKNMPTLRDVWVRNGVIRIIDVGDAKIFGGWTWATYTEAPGAIELDLASNATIVNHDVIPSVNAGYLITGGLSNATIVGGLMDGNGSAEIHPGPGIKVDSAAGYVRSLQIVGVKFCWLWQSAIELYDAQAVTITGCSFRANNRDDDSHPEIDLTSCLGVVATGNTFSAVDARTNKGLIWTEDATSSNNLITNNTLEGSYYAAGVYSVQESSIVQGNVPVYSWPRTPMLAKSADYAVSRFDVLEGRTILVTAAATITLPSVTSVYAGSRIVIKAGATTTLATTSSQTIDGSALTRTLYNGESVTLVADGGNWRSVATQAAPRLVVPPLSTMLTTSATVWMGANTALFSRFALTQPTPLRYVNIRVDVSSGNWQIAVVRLSGSGLTNYTRVMDTTVVAMPTAGDKAVDLGASLLPPGEYAVTVWCDNTTAQLRHASNSSIPITRHSAEVASLASGVPSTGSVTWNSSRILGSLCLEAAT